jgi:hypothetical protein
VLCLRWESTNGNSSAKRCPFRPGHARQLKDLSSDSHKLQHARCSNTSFQRKRECKISSLMSIYCTQSCLSSLSPPVKRGPRHAVLTHVFYAQAFAVPFVDVRTPSGDLRGCKWYTVSMSGQRVEPARMSETVETAKRKYKHLRPFVLEEVAVFGGKTMFMLHLIRQALNPRLNIAACLGDWYQISRSLREPPRKRQLQAEHLEGLCPKPPAFNAFLGNRMLK